MAFERCSNNNARNRLFSRSLVLRPYYVCTSLPGQSVAEFAHRSPNIDELYGWGKFVNLLVASVSTNVLIAFVQETIW